MATTMVILLAITLLDHFVVGPPAHGWQLWLRHGLGDEIGHLLTAYLWVLAAQTLGIGVALWPALVGSTAIDLDHFLLAAGLMPTAGHTGRAVTHSMATLLVLLACAFHYRRSRRLWLSAAFGFTSHLWRDAGTSPVMMGWPFSSALVSYPHWVYVAGTGLLPLVAVAVRQLYRRTVASGGQAPIPRQASD